MKLGELINKINPNTDCDITISNLCDEYPCGVEALKKEEWYKKNRDCKVIDFYIGMSGHDFPEISITIER